MLLPALYHWSPADRRESILREGLVPYAPPVVSSDGGDMAVIAWPYEGLTKLATPRHYGA